MSNEDMASLSEICDTAKMLVRTYESWRERGLVPKYCLTKSRGRGRGREFRYHRDEALRCIELVKKELARGQSLDEIEKIHRREWVGQGNISIAQEFTEMQVSTYLKEKIGIVEREERLRFEFVLEQAAGIGAFRQYKVRRSGGDLLAQIPALEQEQEFLAMLEETYRVYRECGPGNAAMFARTSQVIRDMEIEGADVDPNEEDLKTRQEMYRKWKAELNRLKAAKCIWARRPDSRRSLIARK